MVLPQGLELEVQMSWFVVVMIWRSDFHGLESRRVFHGTRG